MIKRNTQPVHRMTTDVDRQAVTIILATGEEIRLRFTDRLGIEGYGVDINSDKTMVILPGSSNSAVITSPDAMKQLEEHVQALVRARDAARQTNKTGRPS